MIVTTPTYWVMGPPRAESQLAVWAKDEVDVSTRDCPVNPAHTRLGDRTAELSVILPNPPVRQLVWSWHGEMLIQDSAATAFQNAGFKQFELRKAATRFRVTSQESPKFWEFLHRGWGGMARPESGIQLLEQCEHCGRSVYSGLTHPEALIDPVQWDGSDIFMVWPLPKIIFVTDRVRQFVIANNLRDVTFTLVENLDLPKISFSADTTDFARAKLGYPWSTSKDK
jgi:hypothetical protein